MGKRSLVNQAAVILRAAGKRLAGDTVRGQQIVNLMLAHRNHPLNFTFII